MHTLLANFQNAILKNDFALLSHDLKSDKVLAHHKRFAIYADGYRTRLIEAITTDYPALYALLGKAEFEILASSYLEANPSFYYNLDFYPHPFYHIIPFSSGFAHALAVLEGTIASAFMAEESKAFTPAALAALTPGAFACISLKPRLASFLLHSAYPASHWLEAWRAGKKPAIPDPEAEYTYIYRHSNAVKRIVLLELQYLLLQQLFKGLPLEESVHALLEKFPSYQQELIENLQQWIIEWIEEGVFTAPTPTLPLTPQSVSR